MNLICFPHYTCGGLLCDIFSDQFSPMGSHGGIMSINHAIGKIGDVDSIFDNYSVDEFLSQLKKNSVGAHAWIGTHIWPKQEIIPHFDQIVCVTTTTYRSKIYRWSRAYYHYYQSSQPWQNLTDIDLVDKERETAKNYIKPFAPVQNVTNIEFAEIVETTAGFANLVKNHATDQHMQRWKQINDFLYDNDFWQSRPVQRFYEAELEINLQQRYQYQ